MEVAAPSASAARNTALKVPVTVGVPVIETWTGAAPVAPANVAQAGRESALIDTVSPSASVACTVKVKELLTTALTEAPAGVVLRLGLARGFTVMPATVLLVPSLSPAKNVTE